MLEGKTPPPELYRALAQVAEADKWLKYYQQERKALKDLAGKVPDEWADFLFTAMRNHGLV